MPSLAGKVVIITGGSRGIGAAFAKHFAPLGAKLSLAGRDAEQLEQVAASCKELGAQANDVVTVVGDIRNEADRKALIQNTVDHFGKLDVLINNAGVLTFYNVGSVTLEQFQETFEINVMARIALTQLAIPHLKKSKGNIINLSSTLSKHASSKGYIETINNKETPRPAMGAYCMGYAAMDMFTECLALELAEYGVRVNSINPGYIDTGIARKPGMPLEDEQQYQKFLELQTTLHPLGRHGEPSECAAAAEFLASDGASFVTGHMLHVDGGQHCFPPGYTVGRGKKDA